MKDKTNINRRFMMRIAITGLLVTANFIINAQIGYEVPEIEKVVSVPNSPEASAFTKYGNVPVSLYTGRPEINVPLGSIKGRVLEFPVSLSYDASGVKVEQIPGWAGLGWNVNVGGAVTRQVNGLPDDFLPGSQPTHTPFYHSDVESNFESYRDTNIVPDDQTQYPTGYLEYYYTTFIPLQLNGDIDTQPDIYSFSINGLSGKMIVDYSIVTNNTAKGICLERPDLDILVTFGTFSNPGVLVITGWVIKDPNGNEYHFSNAETTNVTSDDQGEGGPTNRSYYSAWYISKIYSTNNRDTMDFEYSIPVEWAQPQTTRKGGSRMELLTPYEGCPGNSGESYPLETTYTITQFELSSITVNGNTMAQFISDNNRLDVNGKKFLKTLTLHEPYREVHFNYTYFGDESTETEEYLRLRLDGLDIKGTVAVNPTTQKYIFSYYGDDNDLPPRNSYQQDYWGLFNGESENDNRETLIPYHGTFDDGNPEFQGAVRIASQQKAPTGTLQSIRYPTGGLTEFHYELNQVSASTQSEIYNTTVIYASPSLSGDEVTEDTYEVQDCEPESEPPANYLEGFTIEEDGNYDISVTVHNDPNGTTPPVFDLQFAAIYPSGELLQPRNFCSLSQDSQIPLSTYGVVDKQEQLTAGYYRILLLNTNEQKILSVKVSREESIEEVTELDGKGGGLRIAKIVDKTDDNTLAQTRYYYYDDLSQIPAENIDQNFLETNEATSGKLQQALNYSDIYSKPAGSQPSICSYKKRLSSNRSVSTNVVTYSAVTEVFFAEGQVNGYTVSEFYNQNETRTDYPVPNSTPLNGKLLSRRIYDRQGVMLENIQETYDVESLPGNYGGFLYYSNAQHPEYIVIDWATSGMNTHRTGNAFFLPSGSLAQGQWQYCAFDADNEPGAQCINDNITLGRHVKKGFGFTRLWIKKVQTLNTRYFNNNSVVVTTDYDYGNTTHYQIQRITTNNSRGDEMEDSIFYAHDLNVTSLIDQHRIGEPVRHKRRVNGGLLQTRETGFADVNSMTLPQTLKFSTGSNPPEPRIRYHQYDIYGNPTEISREDDMKIVYLWGENYRMPVAKIDNATYQEVLNNLDVDTDSLQVLNETDLRTEIGKLRDRLPSSRVTTYTYNTGRVMSSITDPNGIVTYYEYDDHSRLGLIRDDDLNILQKIDYHYSENPQN